MLLLLLLLLLLLCTCTHARTHKHTCARLTPRPSITRLDLAVLAYLRWLCHLSHLGGYARGRVLSRQRGSHPRSVSSARPFFDVHSRGPRISCVFLAAYGRTAVSTAKGRQCMESHQGTRHTSAHLIHLHSLAARIHISHAMSGAIGHARCHSTLRFLPAVGRCDAISDLFVVWSIQAAPRWRCQQSSRSLAACVARLACAVCAACSCHA